MNKICIPFITLNNKFTQEIFNSRFINFEILLARRLQSNSDGRIFFENMPVLSETLLQRGQTKAPTMRMLGTLKEVLF